MHPITNFRRLRGLGSTLLLGAAILASGPLAADSSNMHDAICNSDLTAVKRLLARGVSVNAKMKGGGYPLELAAYCYGGQPRIADYLLKRGAKVNLHGDGYSILMWALRSAEGDPNDAMRKIVVRLLDKGAKVRYQDPTTGRTPLMLAASNGDRQIVDRMLRAGASAKRKTKSDWCVSGRRDIQCNAADHARMGGNALLAFHIEKDRAGAAAYKQSLHYAAKTGNVKSIQRRIAAGARLAELNKGDQLSKYTPLHYATINGHIAAARVLLKAGANPNVLDYAGTTPLRAAVVDYKKDLARLLIDNGAKAGHAQLQGCGGGMSELAWAVSYGQGDLVRYMIEKGAVDPRNPGTAFTAMYGRNESDVDNTALFLKKGARPVKADITQLRKVGAANDWIRKAGHNAKIVALLEEALRKPAPEIKPDTDDSEMVVSIDEDDDLPEIPAELLEIRLRSTAPPVIGIKSRSMRANNQKQQQEFRQQLDNKAQQFDTRFRDADGRLDPRGF